MGRHTYILFALWLCMYNNYFVHATPIEEVFDYHGSTIVKNAASDEVISGWTVSGTLTKQEFDDHITMKLADVKTSVFNGLRSDMKDSSSEKEIPEDARVILEPFVLYKDSDEGYTIGHQADEPVWSVNMKRAIGNIFFVNSKYSEGPTVSEKTIYGECETSYDVHVNLPKRIVSKRLNHTSCEQKPEHEWSNVRWDPAARDYHPLKISVTRNYIFSDETLTQLESTANVEYRSMPGSRSPLHSDQHQKFKRMSSTTEFSTIDISKITVKSNITLEITQKTVQGRNVPERKTQKFYTDSFKEHFQEFQKRFNSYPLEPLSLDSNDTVDNMFAALNQMTFETMRQFYSEISLPGEKQMYDIYLSLLPYLGTDESVNLIKMLVVNDALNDLLTIQILATFPTYVDEPSEKMLQDLEVFMNLETVSNPQVRYAAILSFASLVSDANRRDSLSVKKLTEYNTKYFINFQDAEDYELRMTYLLGLVNMANGIENEIMISIINDPDESRHLRSLAIYGFKNSLITESDQVYENFWPVVKNETEPFEVRVAALDLLLSTELSENQFDKLLYRFNVETEDPYEQHLCNYFYTTLQSLRNTSGYFDPLGNLATETLATTKFPKYTKSWSTGNYRMAYTDSPQANFGGSLQARLVANPITNIINTAQFTYENFAMSFEMGTYSVYVKTEGLADFGYLMFLLAKRLSNDEPLPHLVELIKKYDFKLKTEEEVHVEVVVFSDDKAVFGIHISKDNIDNYSENPLFLDFLKLIVEHNSFSNPVYDYINIPSDFGSTIKITNFALQLSSFKFENFDQIFNEDSDEEEVTELKIKFRSVWSYELYLDSYNPLADITTSTYKYLVDEKRIDFPFTLDLDNKFFKWKNKEDAFNWVSDRLIGTYVDDKNILQKYCKNCDNIQMIPTGPYFDEAYPRYMREFQYLGFKLNLSSTLPGPEQRAIDSIEPVRKYGLNVIDLHQSNMKFSDNPSAQTLLYIWHYLTYSTYADHEIERVILRSMPYYEEPTEMVLLFDIDFDIYNDNDPIDGSKLGLSLVVINQKKENEEKLEGFNMTLKYTTAIDGEDRIQSHHVQTRYLFELESDEEGGRKTICVTRSIRYPNRRSDKLSLESIESATGSTKIAWGLIDPNSTESFCPTTENIIKITEIYKAKIDTKQLKENKDYATCKKESAGLKYVPSTKSCRAIHEKISQYDNCEVFADFSGLQTTNQSYRFKNLMEHKINEFGVKLVEYTRVNEDDVKVSVSEHLKDIDLPFEKLEDFKHPGLISIDPTVVAYDDDDIKYGVAKTCTLSPKSVSTFTGHTISMPSYEGADSIAFIECMNNTQNGLRVYKINDKKMGFTFWSESDTLAVSFANDKLKVSLNGKMQTSTPKEQDSDFKIYFLDSDVLYITNEIVEIYYNSEYVYLKAYGIYQSFICGLCTKQK